MKKSIAIINAIQNLSRRLYEVSINTDNVIHEVTVSACQHFAFSKMQLDCDDHNIIFRLEKNGKTIHAEYSRKYNLYYIADGNDEKGIIFSLEEFADKIVEHTRLHILDELQSITFLQSVATDVMWDDDEDMDDM